MFLYVIIAMLDSDAFLNNRVTYLKLKSYLLHLNLRGSYVDSWCIVLSRTKGGLDALILSPCLLSFI
ncbi:unnamed protein product [Moneuplotes crassus]|uniref:Uncharacterized protein n=1 Tax=Euplotes crassus TaxID=5936 RepID=A0AAD2D3W9_EUPCR|nr:unnamed protein product [Moneuplotes crassus]